MLTPSYSKQFDKDIKRLQKRGKSKEKIKIIIKMLIDEVLLPERCREIISLLVTIRADVNVTSNLTGS